MSFDYGQGGGFINRDRSSIAPGEYKKGNKAAGFAGDNRGTRANRNGDQFEALQRVRLQLDAVASEALSGTVYFEIGNTVWGSTRDNGVNGQPGQGGGALGADGKIVEVKRAYLDWIVPNTDLKVRMGLQGIALPAFTTNSSMVFDDDVAAVVLSNKFNDSVSLTAFWARPYNDNYVDTWRHNEADTPLHPYAPDNYMDNFDLFGLVLPVTLDGVKVTPWAMMGFVGPNSNFTGGMLPSYTAVKNIKNFHYTSNGTINGRRNPLTEYSTGFWAGVTGEVTMWDPFRLAWDLNYGGVYNDQQAFDRSGFYGSLLAEYKMDWGTPGLYFWYSTGDDNNPKNGSERMASISATGNNQFSNFAGSGNPYIAREGVLGSTLIGTWGIGGRIKDMSFMEGLKHTFRINYFGGTNSPAMAKYITGKKFVGNNGMRWWEYNQQPGIEDFNAGNDGLYLTTMDSALEFGLTTDYKIYDNLTFMLDAAYVALWLDQSKSVWGGGWLAGTNRTSWTGANSITDAWNINASFVYDF